MIEFIYTVTKQRAYDYAGWAVVIIPAGVGRFMAFETKAVYDAWLKQTGG